MEINKNNQSANIYWNDRFTVGTEHHSGQNVYISQDFIKNISDELNNLFLASSTVIEIGCGTGELSFFLSQRYTNLNVIGTDFSAKAVEFSNSNHKIQNLSYELFDCLHEKTDKIYDISICSNTLEHFTNPYYLIDKILELSNKLIILVPYNQPVTDGYDCEGGPGHVFQFKDDSFDKYQVYEWFTFSTPGWQHSSSGETPLQLCVCISKIENKL